MPRKKGTNTKESSNNKSTKSTKDKSKKKDEPKKTPVKKPAKSQKKVEIPSNQKKLDKWCNTKQRTVTNEDTDNSSFTEATIASTSNIISDTTGNNDNITNQSTVNNTDTSIFTQDTNVSTSKIISDTTVNNTDNSIFTQDASTSKIISDTTVNNNDTSMFTQGTVSSTEIEFHMDDDTTFFAMPTEVANRSTINNQLESILVPIDIHVDRNQSIESEDIHVDRNQTSTESEESHVEPSNKPSKRKKFKRGEYTPRKTIKP